VATFERSVTVSGGIDAASFDLSVPRVVDVGAFGDVPAGQAEFDAAEFEVEHW
jgi:hypothetical protein